MRFYQDSRAFDCLYFDPQSSTLYGGAGGSFYSLEQDWSDDGSEITLLWISRTSDQGLPNNIKTYQDVVIEHRTGGTPLTVTAILDNGYTTVELGTINSTERTQTTLRMGDYFGRQSLNIAIKITGTRPGTYVPLGCEIFGVFLHWYPEARKSLTWDSDELDQGTQKVKAYRAIELDVNNPGALVVLVYTDMPGNAMAQRGVAHAVPISTTRRSFQIPLGRPYIEGRKVRVLIFAADGVTEFQLYGARIEVQPFGEYVESYEATAGREWDSGTLDLGFPGVKEIREARLDVDTDGALTFDLHTELPGMNLASRSTKTVNTETTTTGRRIMNLPLLTDGQPVEGNLVQAFMRGTSAWRLYGAWLFYRPIGYYVEAYQAADGHIWDSTVLDLGAPQVKRLLQVYFEAHADSPLTVKVYTSNANGEMTLRDTQTLAASTGRKPYIVPLTGVYGRLARVTISSTGAFRLFHVKAYVKPIGVYLNGGTLEVFPVEAEQDIDTERVKLFKEIELVYSGSGTVEFSSDPTGPVSVIRSFTLTASTETRTAKLRLPKEAKGRIMRVLFRPGTTDLQVFECRVWTRTVGENGAVLWQWVNLPIPATPDNYGWTDIYVAPTPPAYDWKEIYVPPTDTPKWDWTELPVKL